MTDEDCRERQDGRSSQSISLTELPQPLTVRFRPSRYVPPQRIGHDLTKRQRTVLAVLSAGGSGLALRDVLARVSPRAQEWELKGDLAILKALGLVRSSGHGRGARWTLGGGPLA